MNLQMTDKDEILAAIKKTRQRIWNEEGAHWDTFDKPGVEEKIAKAHLIQIGWPGLVKLLEPLSFSVDPDFMDECLIDKGYRMTAAQQKIYLIADPEIRHALSFMNRDAQHTETQRTMATIHRLFDSTGLGAAIFTGWQLYHQSIILKTEVLDKSEFKLNSGGTFVVDDYQKLGQSIVEATIRSLAESGSAC